MPATTPTDVINAWNDHCASCNYGMCPDPPPEIRLVDLYHGRNYCGDTSELMHLIQQQVVSANPGNPEPKDWLRAVISDPAWYR